MKNRTLITLGIAVAAMVMLPMVAMAQATDNATLTITGTVPNIVKIGFGNVNSNGTLAIGDLNASSPSGASGTISTLIYAGNVSFEITVDSTNGGTLDYDPIASGGAAPGGFATSVGYSVTVGGSGPADLTGANPVVSAAAGIYQTVDVVVSTDALGVDSLDGSSVVGDIEAAGTYEDTLTFTITAAP